MAFSSSISSSSLFTTCPQNFLSNSNNSPQSPNSIRYKKRTTPISAAYATTENRTSSSKTEQHGTNRSFQKTCSSSLYEVLGVRIGADTREVKAAYRRLARVLHPDVTASSDSSADEFMKIHSAYTTLSDPAKRADYDRTLFQRPSRGVVASPGMTYANAGAYRSRRWETDQCW
uniref:chaperone protein dnaJ 11, chloroplastic-like n=1 Tax=Erigeron canadensis TaxID=72917 RepID=UPI001CB91BAC|nr:chaperone protein dnaJ 11, chloroplastic-like [Erigeron canadensis]